MPFKYTNLTIYTFRISLDIKSPSNPDNKKAYRKFQKGAHQVSVRHGGKYFSEKWLHLLSLYGKYKYYLRRIYKEESVIKHDILEGIKIYRYFLIGAFIIHVLARPFMLVIQTLSRKRRSITHSI